MASGTRAPRVCPRIRYSACYAIGTALFGPERTKAWRSLAGGEIAIYRQDNGLATADVHAMCEPRDGSLWIAGQGNRLTVFDGATFVNREIRSLPTEATVRAMLCAKDGTVWIGTSAGLVRFKDDQESMFTSVDGLANDSVFCLAEGQDHSLWVGTKDGFSRLHNDEWESFGAADGLSQSTVYALAEDREGSLWVGTKHGLNQFNDRRTVPFTVREGLPSNDAGPIWQDAAGTIWVGTLGAGLARFDGRHFSTLNTADGLASNSILALAEDPDGHLWVGTDRGLNRLRDGRVDNTFTATGLPSNVVRAICLDGQRRLWVGTEAGVARLDGSQFRAERELGRSGREYLRTFHAPRRSHSRGGRKRRPVPLRRRPIQPISEHWAVSPEDRRIL